VNKTTIRDIARLAGVSPATVSFAINGKKGVGEETRERILRIIEETGFVPDNNSRRFFFRKNFTVALVGSPSASPFSDIFYYEVAKGLDHESGARGYSVIFTELRLENGRLSFPKVVTTRDTDGLVFLQQVPAEIRSGLRELGLPYVVVDASGREEGFVSVYTDYEQIAYAATAYLIGRGHSAIAFLGANRVPAFYMSTFLGYKRAMEELRAPIPPQWMQAGANDDESAARCMDILLESEPRPTAVFSATDMIAIAAMNRAREKGVRIPEGVSFIGIDDIQLSSYVYPPLTTVRVDKFEMGKAAMDLLIRLIEGQKPESRQVAPGGVMERGSVSWNR
jgi:LacI family sucrose operon transcriptional repressor